jgi:hypothetical protein
MPFPRATTVSIAPSAAVPMAGRGGPERIGRNIDCQLEANILLLPHSDDKLIAIVALDALFGSAELRQAILQALGKEAGKIADIILVASHTHNAPTLDPLKSGLGRCDSDHLETVAQNIAVEICSKLTGNVDSEGSVLHGRAVCKDNVSRRRKTTRLTTRWPFFDRGTHLLPNRSVSTPHNLDIRLGVDSDGKPEWILWSWPCHATSYFDNLAMSADFPGAVRQIVRAALNTTDLPILYLPGFCGDTRSDAARSPIDWKQRVASPFARTFASPTEENYETLCDHVARAVLDALAAAQDVGPSGSEASFVRAALPLSAIMDTPVDEKIALVYVACGSLNLLFMGAETCSPYYPLLAPLFPEHALLTGYADAVPLYLPSDSQIAEGGYEVDGFRHSFGLPGKFHPKIETIIISAVSKLQLRRP